VGWKVIGSLAMAPLAVAPTTFVGSHRAMTTLNLGFQDLTSGIAPLGTMATVGAVGTMISGARVLEETLGS
jgi:hypothetical protein